MVVNYNKEFDKEGNCYTQTITYFVKDFSLQYINSKMRQIADETKFGQIVDGHSMIPSYIRKELVVGKNYLTISQFVALSHILNFGGEKRIKNDRNTIINFELY